MPPLLICTELTLPFLSPTSRSTVKSAQSFIFCQSELTMENMKEDAELALEMVGLLAKELRAAKQRIHELENQPRKDKELSERIKELEAELLEQRNVTSVPDGIREAVAAPSTSRKFIESPSRVSNKGHECEEGEETGANEEKQGLHAPGFVKFLAQLYRPACLSRFSTLTPICKKSDDLLSYLSSVAGSLCPQDILYFPRRTRWQYSRNHALVFSPFQVHKEGLILKSSEFSSLYEEVRELFCVVGPSIYYAGTFRCIPTQHWFPDGVPAPKDISMPTILDVAGIQNNGPMSRAYRDGILKVECMILHCVGFNVALYDRLLERKMPEISVKRKAESGPQRSRKRAKKTKA